MKITSVETHVHQQPPNPRPIRDALQSLPGAGSVEVIVRTDDGLVGRDEVWFGRIAGAPSTLAVLIDRELSPIVVGRDPVFVRAIHEDLVRETEYHGTEGLAMFGIAALDTALWDILGRAAGWPVHRLIGAFRDRIPAYAMVGWMNFTDDELTAACTEAVNVGFHAVKIKVGHPTLEQDAHRVEVVRAAIGPNITLMVDANQSLSTAEAILRGRVFQQMRCYWFEEPLPAQDFDAYAALAAALDIPIATGENLYGRRPFARLVAQKGVDVVQGDLRRGGGPTEILAIGALADAFALPYASHGGGPVNLNLLATMPNATWLETGMPRAGGKLVLEDGCALVPQGPGFSWA
jgi:L-alanine-DL-glutamate epimerase-like enolase superfamily enzyme